MQARLYDILQMSTSGATATRTCCENGRPIMTDPHTGQTICSCQYGSSLLNYPRVPGLTDTVYGASAYAAAQGYMPLGAEGSAFYSPLNGPYDVKENPDGLRGLAQPASYFPYDPSMAVYPYGTGYGGLDLNARRKNATRETTNTLKAWLYEHRKNPYPTKGEKIMLAIITKMTLTQVSTWFANARRRLKKENKMTWSPRNRSEDSADNLDSEGETENKESENGDSSGNTASTSGPEKDERRSEGSPGHIDPEETQGSLSEKLVDAPNDSDADSDDQDAMEPIKAGKLTLCNASKDKHAKVYHRTDAALPLAQQQRHLQNSDFREADSAKQSGANSQSSSQSERHSPTRPKIWSVSQFLPSSPSSSEGSAKSPGLTPSGRIHPSPGYLYLQSASQSWNTGRYGALGTYPMSMSHATLSYPYTLSSQATSKSALGVGSSGLSGVDLLHSADKLAATQKGLFSPARDIDGLRNRIFAKDAGDAAKNPVTTMSPFPVPIAANQAAVLIILPSPPGSRLLRKQARNSGTKFERAMAGLRQPARRSANSR